MAGVNPALKQSLLGHVKSLRDEGRTVLFVEHDMDMVRDISDWVIVMAQGQVIAEGPPDSVMGDQRVIDAYLGSHHDQDLDSEMEEQILAEAQAEFGQVGPPAATSAAEPTAAPSTGPATGHTSTGSTAATEGDHDRA
jgi:ABC-type multidrug transport system ATPase subunit